MKDDFENIQKEVVMAFFEILSREFPLRKLRENSFKITKLFTVVRMQDGLHTKQRNANHWNTTFVFHRFLNTGELLVSLQGSGGSCSETDESCVSNVLQTTDNTEHKTLSPSQFSLLKQS